MREMSRVGRFTVHLVNRHRHMHRHRHRHRVQGSAITSLTDQQDLGPISTKNAQTLFKQILSDDRGFMLEPAATIVII